MGEYGKAVDKLMRIAKTGSRNWQGEERDVPIGNGEFKWGKLNVRVADEQFGSYSASEINNN